MRTWIYHRIGRTGPRFLFGQAITIFRWGVDVRLPGAWLVWQWQPSSMCYISRDATPSGAALWLWHRREPMDHD